MDMGRVARGAAWTLAGGALLVVGAYLALVAINWNDEVASPQALQLERIVRDRPPVDDEANGYVYALGLGVREDQDPLAWGRTRKTFLENISPQQTDAAAADFPGPDAESPRATRTPASAALMEACRRGDQACLEQLQRDPEEIDRLLASQAWLLDRYIAMTTRTQWRETIPGDIRAPFPPYATALDGQQLLLLKAWRHARQGQADAVGELLQRDMTFWRMVLGSSDILITKMIAAAAVDRHFQIGNLILRELHRTGANAAVPASWQVPMCREERSMRRVLAGEWHYASAGLDTSLRWDGDQESSALGRFADRLIRPLFKKQSTVNLFADRMVRLSDRLDVELRQLPEALDATEAGAEGKGIHFYNPFGHILYDVGAADYQGYAAGVADLEGTRRAVIFAAESRGDGQVDDMPGRLQRSALKNPYTQTPFTWDEASRSIVFTGLAPGERGTRALLL